MISEVVKKLNIVSDTGSVELERIKTLPDAERFRAHYLGRKGAMNQIFKEFAVLPDADKKALGEHANAVKNELRERFKTVVSALRTEGKKLSCFDETIPGIFRELGSLHPITQFITKITDIFIGMGFEIIEDREVETTEYNFDKLNILPDHPARDMWDTFYVASPHTAKHQNEEQMGIVLRTHTSPVQLRAMETRRPPVRLVVPGRCYRHEATDASHETNFYQLEGLVIDKGISVANMIYVLDQVLKRLFGKEVKIRIRPSFFPFVEPGHEVDMSCIICEQKGCSVCGGDGWVEMMGAGMVHPVVLANMKVNSDEYSGFAFGMGIDRLMMLYYGVDDIRLSYSGDLRFLKQF